MSRLLLFIFLFSFVLIFSASALAAGEPLPSLLSQAESALDQARADHADLLAPRYFDHANDAFQQAKSLSDRKGEEELVRVKLKLCMDELDNARRAAVKTRTILAPVLEAREAALSAGADTLSASSWKRAEDRFRSIVSDAERGSNAVSSDDQQTVAGTYRAARRDALRIQILSSPREHISEVERKDGDRNVPTLLLRAQQAISRAEANLAQEDLEGARNDARIADQTALHALALMAYSSECQKQKQPWEAALLPYDDLLHDAAQQLGGTLDFANGGAQTGTQLSTLIKNRLDSLTTQAAAQRQIAKSLEGSLAEAQTQLADAQGRIAQLEKRLVEREKPPTPADTTKNDSALWQKISQVQQAFKAGEALVTRNERGDVLIRVHELIFTPGATNLNKVNQKVLDRACVAIAQFPGAYVTVEGHTDSDGTEEENQKLMADRAKSVAVYLTEKLNLPAEKVRSIGVGEAEPIATNDTAAGRALNRRFDIVLTLP
jgi:OmpA-OmpF porin, OOP family